MKTLVFQGYSDDTFGELECFGITVDNYANQKPIQCHVKSSEGELLVVGQYAKSHLTGCWVIGISMIDENVPIPNWPIRFLPVKEGYSPILEIDVPDDVTLTFYNNRKKVKTNG